MKVELGIYDEWFVQVSVHPAPIDELRDTLTNGVVRFVVDMLTGLP